MGHGNMNVRCNANDQNVLSILKHSIKDPLNRLSSWSIEEVAAIGMQRRGPIPFTPTDLGLTPSWLYTQRSLSFLDVSSSGLSFNVHDKFWSFATQIYGLSLANNSITGDISTTIITNAAIDLHSNNFTGLLPRLSSEVTFFHIANNKFSGPIYPLLCQNEARMQQLRLLDMSHDLLSGELPDCWMHWQSLLALNLESNKLSGKIYDSLGKLTNPLGLRLGQSGDVPSLKSCKQLFLLDLAFNEFTGNVPSWTGSLPGTTLLLRSDKFNGTIPSQICQLSYILMLYLADNRLSGPIPKCFNNFTTMVTYDTQNEFYYDYDVGYLVQVFCESYLEDLLLYVKGQYFEYDRTFWDVRFVNLSSNELSGSIPLELLSLIAV
ncbi:receptor-like protein EIX2 [Abrus precatorius]|uniref:Receptor-like protein EIX2 n=1 Tax=Abrus precatorius TaxID=3816 RepID=A0A8B8KWU9_ABRPR|nr:receptor-like protein EIX2 [Abrus precatorius]